MKYIFLFVPSLIFSMGLQASPLSEKKGWSGDLSLIAGVISSNSNLSTANEFKQGALDTKGKQDTQFIAGPLGNIRYTFGETANHRLFLGTSRDDIAVGIIALEAGYQYRFPSKMEVAISYLPSIIDEKIWQDPYVSGANKQETKRSGHAFRFQLKNILGTPFSTELAYGSADIKKELSGEYLQLSSLDRDALNRNADFYYTKLSYKQFLGRGLGVAPSLFYLENDAKGNAMSYASYGFELTSFLFMQQNRLVATLGYYHDKYKAVHPVFNQKREENRWSAFLAYERGELFDVKPLSFILLAGYEQGYSNVLFYDKTQYLLSTGLSYTF